MNYIVAVSDSHGRREEIRKLLPVINGADMFIFLGDCTGDIYALKKEITVPVVAVNGNCDAIKVYEDEEIVSWRGHRILAAHGHKYGVKRDLLNITYAAKEKMCDCVLFGHTHEAVTEENDGVLLINPGSIAEPSFSLPSYCMATEENGKIFPKIIYIKP